MGSFKFTFGTSVFTSIHNNTILNIKINCFYSATEGLSIAEFLYKVFLYTGQNKNTSCMFKNVLMGCYWN